MRQGSSKRSGLILVVTLWIMALISLICIGLAHRLIIDLKLLKFQKQRMQSLYIVRAAIQKALSVLTDDQTPEVDTLNEKWSSGYDKENNQYIFKDVELDGGWFTISCVYNRNNSLPLYFYGMSDEERKININLASKKLLTSLFELMGADDPELLSENIIYWRGDMRDDSYQDPYYENGGVPYPARQAPFRTIQELSLVKGLRENPKLVEKCKDVFTVYTDNLVNINTVSFTVLKAIFVSLGADKISLDLSTRLADNIVDYRDGQDDRWGTEDDVAISYDQIKQVLTSHLYNSKEIDWVNSQFFPFTAKSKLFKIEIATNLKSSKIQKRVTAIVERLPTVGLFKFRFWHEE